MARPRFSIMRLMTAVFIIALNCAVVVQNEGLLFLLPILDLGLLFLKTRAGSWRPFWVGFELFGWSLAVASLAAPWELSNRWIEYFLNHVPIGLADSLMTWQDSAPVLLWELTLTAMIALPALGFALLGGVFGSGAHRLRRVMPRRQISKVRVSATAPRRARANG